MELETARDSLQKALADAERRLTEAQEKSRWRERDLATALDESKASNRTLEEDKKNLEIRLGAVTQDANDLRVRAGNCRLLVITPTVVVNRWPCGSLSWSC